MDRDEREVAGCGADERGPEHVPGEVILVGHLEREHRAGRGRFEDRGDARGCARHEQQPAVLRREQARKPLLQRVAERRTEIQRRAFEPHRCAASQRGDAGDHARRERPQRERIVGIMECVEVLVGSRRRARRADPTQRERGDRQPDERRDRDTPQWEAIHLRPARVSPHSRIQRRRHP